MVGAPTNCLDRTFTTSVRATDDRARRIDAAHRIWSVAAPRQAGMSDWYLVAQLKNFRQGLRGRHPDDGLGWQMGLMSEILHDDQAIDDVVAYINTL